MPGRNMWFPVFATLAGFTVAGVSPAGARSQLVQGSVSLGSMSVRDDLLVPLTFAGPAIGLHARYGLAAGPHRAEADLDLGVGILRNRFDHRAEQLSHGIAAAYRYRLDRGTELGASARWHDELSYLESWDDAHGYWLSRLVLGATARDLRRIGSRVRLETRADLAVFGLVARPPQRRLNKQDALPRLGRAGQGAPLRIRNGRDRPLGGVKP